jgi:GAF domain-containing protein
MRDASSTDPIGTETLYAVIGAIAEGPDLDRVLRAVVDLLADATACHACFVYLREGDRLRIRAASPVFAHAVGKVTLGMDEGLTGWVARHRTPAFIREAAMDDPRMKYVPELHEERFQSMVAVPLVDRHGDVIGVVVLHTEAPREFGQDVLDLLVHVASLVVGAIDNARLYEQTQQQVAALSALSALSQKLASLTRRDELYTAGCEGIGRLLDARHCRLSLFDSHGAAVEVASYPDGADDDAQPLLHAAAGGRLTARLLEGSRALGLMRVARDAPFAADDARLLETATNQLALALRTAELIERLAAENRVRQMFEALERGDPDEAAAHARAAGWDPARTYVAVVAVPSASGADRWEQQLGAEVERRLRLLAAGALADVGPAGLRALVALPGRRASPADPVRRLCDELAPVGADLGVSFGISQPRQALAESGAVLGEAQDAARVAAALNAAGDARTFADLGPFRFLVSLIGKAPPDPEHARALTTLAEYDGRRGSTLLSTLEAYLAARRVVRATAEALVIHPNTLRQRLERIEALTGLSLDQEDLLSLELSLKVHRLQQ